MPIVGYTQDQNPFVLETPLGKDKLLVRSFAGEEHLSGLFQYRLELLSEYDSLDFSQIVGKSVTLTLSLPGGSSQYVNGIVGRFVQGGQTDRMTYYYADLHPWLWMLTMSMNCKIFQNVTAPDIIQKVFSDLGFTDYRNSLTATYQTREYCVQYNETAFAFVSRLMEEEGIFYFFEHSASKHTLVLADDVSAYLTAPGVATVKWRPVSKGEREEINAITHCALEQQLTSGQFKTTDYNFEMPQTSLLVTASGSDTSRSIFEYPGNYSKQDPGETVANTRLAEMEAMGKTLTGTSTCRAFHCGCKFTLQDHYRSDVNGDYVLRSITHHGEDGHYSNRFVAFPSATTFRPPRHTPRPKIVGSQTALVTGKSGEEIWTDKYGRIKVKFHWDQADAKDETSSCWIRVAQGWAGKQWGSMFLPRVGQEVVVSFLDGDPDRPLVTGSVYNAEQTTPYTLPDDQTKSTIKSNSSKGGEGFNELRFEDKKGSEEVFLQAQKDLTVSVLNNETRTIKQSRTTIIQEADEALTVEKGNRTVKVNTGNETHEVKGTRALTVTGNETHTNKADFKQEVTGNYTLKVSGDLSIEVTGKISIKSTGAMNLESTGDMTHKSSGALTNQSTGALTNKSSVGLTNQAGTSLTNKAGTTLTNKGGVSLSNEAPSISSKADATQTVDGGGMLTLKGGLVKIN